MVASGEVHEETERGVNWFKRWDKMVTAQLLLAGKRDIW